MLQGNKWQEFKKNGDEKEMTWRLVKYLGDGQGTVHLEHPEKSYIDKLLYADEKFIIFKIVEALKKGMKIVEEVYSRYGLTL